MYLLCSSHLDQVMLFNNPTLTLNTEEIVAVIIKIK